MGLVEGALILLVAPIPCLREGMYALMGYDSRCVFYVTYPGAILTTFHVSFYLHSSCFSTDVLCRNPFLLSTWYSWSRKIFFLPSQLYSFKSRTGFGARSCNIPIATYTCPTTEVTSAQRQLGLKQHWEGCPSIFKRLYGGLARRYTQSTQALQALKKIHSQY